MIGSFEVPSTLALAAVLAFAGVLRSQSTPAGRTATEPSPILGRAPSGFVENRGQWDARAAFHTRSGPVQCWLTTGGMTVAAEAIDVPKPDPIGGDGVAPAAVAGSAVAFRLAFVGADPCVTATGEDRLPGVRNYFFGADPARWVTGVPAFTRVRYAAMYPGVDVVVRQSAEGLAYDLHVAPGADVDRIVVRCEGHEGLYVGERGELVLDSGLGTLRQTSPVSWQVDASGASRPVASRFRVIGDDCFGFAVEERASDLPLVIDPGLSWSTFLGGSNNDDPGVYNSIAVAENGEVLICGSSRSTDFPTTTGAYDPTWGGMGPLYVGDAFVTRYAADGRTMVWSTYLGGASDDRALRARPSGVSSVLVAGWTSSPDFPVTQGAYQTVYGGQGVRNAGDAFTARLDWDGAQQRLGLSTYFGASRDELAFDCVEDAGGNIVFGGWTTSPGLPTTPASFQPTYAGEGPNGFGDGYVAVLDPAGSRLLASTYLGGRSDELVLQVHVDDRGGIVASGRTISADLSAISANALQPAFGGTGPRLIGDGFVAVLDATLASLSYGTYLGGPGDEAMNASAVGPTGEITVAGWTESASFPTTPNAFQPALVGGPSSGPFDGFVARIDPRQSGGPGLLWSTFYGRAANEGFNGVAVERSGVVTVAGSTEGPTWTTAGAFDTVYNGNGDGIVARLDPRKGGAAQLEYATYLGGSASYDWCYSVDIDPRDGAVAVSGVTRSADFPTHNPIQATLAGGYDAFAARLDMFPAGAWRYGHSTPACAWPIYASVASQPTAGTALVLRSTGAAPSSVGAMLVGLPVLPPGLPVRVLNVDAFVNPIIVPVPVSTDATGAAELVVPLPPTIQLPAGIGIQWVFATRSGCVGSGPLSTSDGVRI